MFSSVSHSSKWMFVVYNATNHIICRMECSKEKTQFPFDTYCSGIWNFRKFHSTMHFSKVIPEYVSHKQNKSIVTKIKFQELNFSSKDFSFGFVWLGENCTQKTSFLLNFQCLL